MRITKKVPQVGDIRFVKRFLFFPLSLRVEVYKKRNLIVSGTETRWLEFVTIKERFVELADGDGHPFTRWEPVEFVQG